MEAALITIVILLALLASGMWFLRAGDKRTADRERAKAKAALHAVQKERDQAITDRDEARQASVQAEGDLTKARQDAEKAGAKVADLEQRFTDARSAMEERDELSRVRDEQADRLSTLDVELGDARNQLTTASSDLEAARARVAETEEELATADRRVAEVEKDVQAELQALRTQLADARDDLAVARAKAEAEAEEVGRAGVSAPPMAAAVPAAVVPAAVVSPAGGALLLSTPAAAMNLWELELLRIRRAIDGIDHARVELSHDPAEALVQALRIEVSAMRDLVGTGGEVMAETLPPVTPTTALMALRVSQEILGVIGRQCDQVDVVVSDEDGLTITVAGQQPDDPVDPAGVLDWLKASGAASGVVLATVPEAEVFLVVANFAGVANGLTAPDDGQDAD